MKWEEEGLRRVPAGLVMLATAALVGMALVAWLGLTVVRCHTAFEWLVGPEDCGAISIVVPVLTILAAVVGGVIAWRLQNWWPFVLGAIVLLAPLAAFPFAPYGLGGVGPARSLEEQVENAMTRLPEYDYELLPARKERGYVVFNAYDVVSRASVTVAFAGLRNARRCPRPPKLPRRHRRGPKPFSAAGPEPIICYEDDARLVGRSPKQSIPRIDLAADIANALCEEAVGGYAFECFD